MDDSLSLGNAFRNLIQRVDLLAFCLDKQKRVTFCNEYLLKLTGYSREEVIGSNWFEKFCPAEVRDELAESCAQYADDGLMPRQLIMEIQTATGERLQISCYGTTLFDESGEIVGTAGIAENVTDRLAIKRDLMASQKRLCELSAELSLGQLARTAGDKPADGCRQVHLSAREREIFKWVKDGKTYWEISQILGISERTVKFHVKNVMRKLGVSSRMQAIASVLSQGLLDLA